MFFRPPTRFISVEVETIPLDWSSQLSNLLEYSIGYIKNSFVQDLFLLDVEKKEITCALFKSLGTSLNRFTIGYTGQFRHKVPSIFLASLVNVEELILERHCYFDADIFTVLSNLRRLRSLSVALSGATSPGESGWLFLDFIKISSVSLKTVILSSDDDVAHDKLEGRMEELKEAAEIGKVEIKFPLEWEKKFAE